MENFAPPLRGVHCPLDGGVEFREIEGFETQGVRAQLHAGQHIVRVENPRHHDDAHTGMVVSNMLQQIDAACTWHEDIGNDKTEAVLRQGGQRAFHGVYGVDLESGPGVALSDQIEIHGIIVDDEYACAHWRDLSHGSRLCIPITGNGRADRNQWTPRKGQYTTTVPVPKG